MLKKLTRTEFINETRNASGGLRFSDEALNGIFDYFEFEYPNEDFEQVNSWCGAFLVEYADLDEVRKEFGVEYSLDELKEDAFILEIEGGRLLVKDYDVAVALEQVNGTAYTP